MFDYSNGFAATGSIGGYNFNIGNSNPYGYQQTYYPQGYQVGGQVTFGQDNTMLYLLLAVAAVVLLTK